MQPESTPPPAPLSPADLPVNENDVSAPHSVNSPGHGKVIQPINDMSAYAKQQSYEPAQPVPPAQPTSLPTGSVIPADPRVYADSTPLSPQAPQAAQKNASSTAKQRVVSRVPAVQVYAFLVIMYGVYSLVSLSSSFS